MTVQALANRRSEFVEWASAVAKAKFAWVVLYKWTSATVLGLWLFSGAMVFRAGVVIAQYGPPPSVGEMERHLESDDRRLDKAEQRMDSGLDSVNDKIEKRFDALEQDRQDRKRDSDARYQDLNNRVTLLWGGIGVLGFLLTVGIIKLNTNPAKGMSREDLEMLASFAQEIKVPRRGYNRQDSGKD